MYGTVYKSEEARKSLRRILEAARSGRDSIIEHYDTPTAAVIPYEDFLALQDELDDLRAGRRAQAAYEAWQHSPSLGRAWQDVKADLADRTRADAAPLPGELAPELVRLREDLAIRIRESLDDPDEAARILARLDEILHKGRE